MVSRYSRALLPTITISSRIATIVLPFALTRGRKIHTMSKDEEWWKKIRKRFAIAGKKILTNAHVVEGMNDHIFVHVKRHGSQVKYKAKVQKIAHECDLAILEIDSDEFWKGMNPLEFGDIPPLNEIVYVVGYPKAGETICVTKGVVTGVKTGNYLRSSTKLLTIHIDATTYGGNSGGPVITGDKVLGVLFQILGDKKSTGVVIPTPIIRHFITGAEESSHNAVFGSLVLSCQSMKNAQIRNHFKMSPETTGILINKINSSSGAHKILRKDDIILAIDGVPVGNDKTCPFRNEERISFNHFISMKKPDENILVKVLRKGKEHEYNISLKPVKPHIQVQQYYNLPSYYIFGGFVFVPLTKSYIDDKYYKITDEQHVIISQVMPDDINKGYSNFKDLQVEKVNGVKVKNLKHLRELIEGCFSKDLRLDLENDKVMRVVSLRNLIIRSKIIGLTVCLGVVFLCCFVRRNIHSIHEDEKKLERWKKIEESHPLDELVLDSVVKVFSNSTEYSKSKPWKTLDQKSSRGTGFAIAGRKILTNAHVVMAMNDHTFVDVQRHGSQIKYKAKVQKISHECDLAILEIDSDEFWKGMNPLELGDIPPLQEVVSVVGGENICITKGLVLRVETRIYDYSDSDLLSIQIDATINDENSGGPVIMGNKVVGVVYEIGFVIPTPIIKHFITSVQESRQYSCFGSLDLSYQSLENVQIRNHFKMSHEMTGILINKINSSSGAYKILRKDDIILAIDGVPIGNDEKVPFQNKRRIDFSYLVSMKKPGEKALVKVLRNGKEYEYNISLKAVKPNFTVQQFYNVPSYYIFGGFVFAPLTKTYLDSEHHQVKISERLADDINEGYQSLYGAQVEKVNGVEVKNLKHLCELIEECSTEDLRLDFKNHKVLVLNYESAKKATLQILERHKIKSVISKDICLPMLLDDPFKDNKINLLPWSVLPLMFDFS
ncbi:unnamed protein product [Arabidopsis thaliana]|uniref:(thale cress) hypothetical protein n=1 Tax=Arabidopsis thaliana TaxID=3702 RepID=A0A7G2EQI5_ARATH|nr:unnamed protein product [Arabidopsis thaliana]